MKLILKNKKAYHDYNVEDDYICGIKLIGCEVKSVLSSKLSISESYVYIDNNKEVWLIGANITKYEYTTSFESKKYDPVRKRKLLLNKSEINKLTKKVKEKGYTLIPLEVIYSDTKKIKIKIGLSKGKNKSDKRNQLKDKQIKRDMNREIKEKNR
jgi:SsrA-binding protein